MRFSLTTLKQYLDTNATVAEIADKLTMIGLEVEEVQDLAANLKGYIVAEIRVVEQPRVLPPVRPEPEKPKPWEKVVDLSAFFNQCWISSYQIQAIIIPGWTMGNIECTPTGASTSWRLTNIQEGRLSWMNFGLDEYQLENMKINV